MTSEQETNEAADGMEEEEELSMTNVENPRDSDVLCGRGGAALRHPGNKTYRTLVQLNKGLYITCIKSEKLKISKSIVAAIREQKGRFLEKNKNGTWDDIGEKKAVEKTSQALREGQPKLKKKIAELGGSAAAAMAQNQGYSAPAPPPEAQQRQHSYSSSDGNLATAAAVAFAANEYSQYEPQQQPSLDQQTAMAFQNHQFLSSNMSPRSSMEQMPPPSNLHQLCNIQEESNVNRMRPSMLQRGSIIAHELGVDPQAFSSNRSILSDFSNFGMGESALMMETGSRRSLACLDLTLSNPTFEAAAAAAAAADEEDSGDSPSNVASVQDRRRFFAKMKFSRPASGRMHPSGRMMTTSGRNIDSARSLGDGMPDIHLVESNMSLYSNMSSIGEPGEPLESRRSIMSGLSKISDTEDGNSIFSDLSKKIGNVSTRSMAMSEISNMDDIDTGSFDTADKPTASPPQPMTSSSMDVE